MALKDFSRIDRLAAQITRELSQILLKEVPPPKGLMISINEVELSRDLRQGKVYYSVYGGEDAVAKAQAFVQDNQKALRKTLAGKIRIKYMPEFEYIIDQSIEREQRISELLEKIKSEENEQE